MGNQAIRNVLRAATIAPLLAAAFAIAGEDPPAEIADVLNKLHFTNQREMFMGQQAKELGQSQAVKDYGATLERDHTAADEKVAALARKKNIELPAISPEQVKHEMPAGPAFDEHFAKMMVEDHKKNLESVKAAQEKASDPELKELLTDLIPTLEKHSATAESLGKKPE